MEYQLDDNYRIRTDKMNWILQELNKVEDRKTKEIKEVWGRETYHGTFEQTLNYYSDEVLRGVGKVTESEILKAIQDLKIHISKIVKDIKINLKDLHE